MTTASEEVWFILLQGEQLGPLSFEDVLDFYYKDVVTSDSLLWREGWSDWVALIQIPEFNTLLFQGAVIEEQVNYAQAQQTPEEATAFLEHQNFHQLQETQAPVSNLAHLPNIDKFEELEDLDELVELEAHEDDAELIASNSPKQEGIQSAYHAPANTPVTPKKSNPVGIILLLLLLIGGGAAYVLKPWETQNDPKGQLSLNGHAKQNLIADQQVQLQKSSPQSDLGQGISNAQQTITKTDDGKPTINANDNAADPGEKINTDQSSNELALPQIKSDQGTLGLPIPAAETVGKTETNQVSQTDTKSPGIEEIELDIDTPFALENDQGERNNDPTNKAANSKAQNIAKLKKKRVSKGSTKKRASSKIQNKKTTNSNKINKGSTATATKKKANETTKANTKVTLGRGDLMTVLKNDKAKFKRCLSLDPKLKGTVNVMVVIQRNGRVSSARATSAKLRKSTANDCVITTVKQLKFPSYTGDLLSIPLPITL